MMKVLIISESDKSIKNYEYILKQHKIDVVSLCINANQNIDQLLHGLNKHGVTAIILDRVNFQLDLISKYLSGADIFFVITNWQIIERIKPHLDSFTYRFYLWPANYSLLIDDLKSICKFKEYVKTGIIDLGQIFINLNSHSLTDGKETLTLKNKEFELLVYLAHNRGRVLSRATILENVWDMNSQIITNTVDVHVSKVRKLLKENFGITNLIKTIPCCGYQLV